ncbi:ribonuclease P protein component [Costertonia aggregata]|uniref:Ribonuclease P protein component n=2 Tax=Costertonia aggregata TaxID=343403 RepID=A0A7H9AUS1_9FLAO|nr:ribonuclease P protein component [Costertonia aggregata]
MTFTFSKNEKLKSKKLMQRLFAEGSSVSSYPIKLIYLKTTLPGTVRFRSGVAVPKKNFKSAVHRNRIKRLLRESYRLNKPTGFNNSEDNFAFLFLYIGKNMPSYSIIEHHMVNVLKNLEKKISYE